MEKIAIENDMKVTDDYPLNDSITIEIGNYHIAVYLDPDEDRRAHVDIHNTKTKATKYLTVGVEEMEV